MNWILGSKRNPSKNSFNWTNVCMCVNVTIVIHVNAHLLRFCHKCLHYILMRKWCEREYICTFANEEEECEMASTFKLRSNVYIDIWYNVRVYQVFIKLQHLHWLFIYHGLNVHVIHFIFLHAIYIDKN